MLEPATLTWREDGTPYSPAYGDVYTSAAGGLEQARQVFIAGNGLPERWLGRSFVIVETGFGLGLNFLATWQAWCAQPGRRLHYIALEKHPLRLDDLRLAHQRWPELAPLAASLQAHWPPPLPGLHRLHFGTVILTLAFGEAAELLSQLVLQADAFYLDGFAPAKNPALWSPKVCSALGRLAAPQATLATWSVAASVRSALTEAGFLLTRRPGFGGKREMLVGVKPASQTCLSPKSAPSRRRIAIIGAGVAGASIARALHDRGQQVVVVEAADRPAAGASGNHAGVFRPLPSPNDGRQSRLLRAGFLFGRHWFARLDGVQLDWCGALHLARDARHEDLQRQTAAQLPAEFCRFVEREEACQLTGWPVEFGGWLFPQAGWINPPSLCRALLDGLETRYGHAVDRIERQQGLWQLLDAQGQPMAEADEVVLANGIDAPRLAATTPLPLPRLPIRAGRGQVSHLPADAVAGCSIVATRAGYLTPVVDGLRCAGASLQIGDLEPAERLADHIENLQRLEAILPGASGPIEPSRLSGRVSFRPLSPDKLPLIGPLSASDGLWLIDGFGARGLVYASICAELLASQICGEPLPLEADLVQALDPARGIKASKPR